MANQPRANTWSNLPKEIISKVETRLESAIDMSHLRSVCKNWHCSRNPDNISILCPFLPRTISNDDLPFTDRPNAAITLVARAVFLVKPLRYSTDSCGFLLTVEENVPGKLRILYPLSKDPVINLPPNRLKYLDLSKFSMSQVDKCYGLKYESDGKDVPGVRRVLLCGGYTAMVLYGEGILIGIRLKTGIWSYVRHSLLCSFWDILSYGVNHVRAVDREGNVHTIDHKATRVVETVQLGPILSRSSDHIILLESNGVLFATACVPEHYYEVYIRKVDEVKGKWIFGANTMDFRKVLFLSSDWRFFLHDSLYKLKKNYDSGTRLYKYPINGDFVIYSDKSFASASRYCYTRRRLYNEAGLDIGVSAYFCNSRDETYWNELLRSTTTDLLWPPPTWLWPDTSLSSREDEDLDIVNIQNTIPCIIKEQLPCALDASTQAVTENNKVLRAKFTAVGNSDALTIQHNSRSIFHGIEVQSEHLPILEKVWKKHGDVINGSVIQSSEAKSMALGCLAKILITLQTSGGSFTNDQVTYLKSTLSDLLHMNLKIRWLSLRVGKIWPLHKQLQDQLVRIDEAKMQAEKAEKSLATMMAEVRQELDMYVFN